MAQMCGWQCAGEAVCVVAVWMRCVSFMSCASHPVKLISTHPHYAYLR